MLMHGQSVHYLRLCLFYCSFLIYDVFYIKKCFLIPRRFAFGLFPFRNTQWSLKFRAGADRNIVLGPRVVQYCRIYSIGTIREFRGAIMGETD